MAGFTRLGTYVDAMVNGAESFCSFRKVPSQASVAGQWADLSMAAGNPVPNYYAATPKAAAVLDGMDGIFHGTDKTPSQLYLSHFGLVTPTAAFVGQYKLMDYLLYYPFVDLDDTTTQTMTNVVPLPRYTTGAGVRAMMVTLAPTTGSGQFTFDYVNQDGDTVTSPTQFCNTAVASIATISTCQQATAAGQGPFLPLRQGDTGIQSIVSLTMTVANGGLGALVLVKPLADFTIREISTMSEISFLNDRMGPPRIYDGAYLNMIVNCAASIAAGQLTGYAKFVWN